VTGPVLELVGIQKSFGPLQAVRGADFVLLPGEVHALLGENGAGKSTLMRIAAGLLSPDRGAIKVRGAAMEFRSPRDARRRGIGMVHQHFTSIPAFSVGENVALSSDWPIRPREIAQRVTALGRRIGFELDPAAKAENLSIAALQRLEILKVLASDASILILDEPTGSLTPPQAAELLTWLRQLVSQGAAAVLITHKLEDAIRYADRVTVLRKGSVTLAEPVAGRTASDLARSMLGEAPPERRELMRLVPGSVVVSAQDIQIDPSEGRGPGIRSGTFDLRVGETVGIAAVEGNGETELLRALAGLVAIAAGKLIVHPPVSLVPEDRTNEGIIADFSLTENLTLGLGASAPWVRHGWVDNRAARRQARSLLDRYDVVYSAPDDPAGTLSGGNQQKLILARALERKPRVLIAENPGRGLDVRASQEAFVRLRSAASEGAAVIIRSSDLDELLAWCDRILVVVQGRVHPAPANADRDVIGRLMLAIDP
jgi:general nucleoside transport system ATP-binding protein